VHLLLAPTPSSLVGLLVGDVGHTCNCLSINATQSPTTPRLQQAGDAYVGGAIYIATALAALEACIFKENAASRGGALAGTTPFYLTSPDIGLSVKGSTFTLNKVRTVDLQSAKFERLTVSVLPFTSPRQLPHQSRTSTGLKFWGGALH